LTAPYQTRGRLRLGSVLKIIWSDARLTSLTGRRTEMLRFVRDLSGYDANPPSLALRYRGAASLCDGKCELISCSLLSHELRGKGRNESTRLHCARRWCSGVAARRSRAAALHAGDRVPSRRIARQLRTTHSCLPPGSGRGRIRRGPECGCPIPLGRRSTQPFASARKRSGEPPGRCSRDEWQSCGRDREVGDHNKFRSCSM